MKLHPKYIEMLSSLLDSEDFESVLNAYNEAPVRGLRFNSRKHAENPFECKVSEINPDVFIPDNYTQTVTHPLHHAGCYYIQDPSATTPVLALDIQVDDVVIDLCAAPGGKSTYILDKLTSGFLVSNEIDTKRNQKLVHNLQRWGHENVVVTQAPLEIIAKNHPNTFDKVLLDAPCSGEGLFRRRPDFALEYKEETSKQFAKLQLELLESAYRLVKDNGVIVYATCTLNETENEDVVASFLDMHPNVTVESIHIPNSLPSKHGLGLRILPSEFGEGQYLIRLNVTKRDEKINTLSFKEKPSEIESIKGNFRSINDTTYVLRKRGFLRTKLSVTMDGTPFGVQLGKAWNYDHALSQAVEFKDTFKKLEVDVSDAYRYLYGHTLDTQIKGIHCVEFQNNSLGFVKGTGTHANNRYPKGLRNKFDSYKR